MHIPLGTLGFTFHQFIIRELPSVFQLLYPYSIRDERTWAIAIRPFYANQKFRTEFPYFSRQKRPEFRRKRDLYEPLLTAMAQVLPFLILIF